MKFWHYAAGEPWAITETALNTLLTIASRQHEAIEGLPAKHGKALEKPHLTDLHEGTAIIPVVGPLFRYANIFTAISGASSYELLAKAFNSALENTNVHRIILDIDSPGGEVNGCAELAAMIFHARDRKPIIAYVSGDAASGAYWIASACESIYASETAMLGSIGVVAAYRDSPDKCRLEIVSSQSPYKRLDPKTEDGKSRLQSRIDDLASVFIETIAKHRGVDPPTVIKDFGGGDVLVGKHAVRAGLADHISHLDAIIQPHAQNLSPVLKDPIAMAHQDPTPETPPVITRETVPIDALSETPEDTLQQAVKQERERIGAIIASNAAKGREPLAQHLAFSTDMTVAMALATLNAAPVATETALTSNTGFEQVMATIHNPTIEPDTPDTADDDADTIAQRIAQFSHRSTA